MDKAETKILDGEDQNEEFSQKEVGKDNIKEKLKNMEDRSRNSRKTEREEKRKIKKTGENIEKIEDQCLKLKKDKKECQSGKVSTSP